jgi:hypothetical protein
MAETRLVVAFDRSLYLPEAVAAAVDAYAPYTESQRVETTPTEVIVTLEGYDEGYGEAFGDQFANHALFESVVRAREALGG